MHWDVFERIIHYYCVVFSNRTSMFKLILQYFVYLFKSKSGRGHGIHSPFVFDFTQKVLSNNSNKEALNAIDNYVNKIKTSNLMLPKSCFGAGSAKTSAIQSVRRIISHQSVPKKYGKLLYNLAQWVSARNILELGTSVGVGTMYLASSSGYAKITTIEGDETRCQLAIENLKNLGLFNVKVVQGSFGSELPKVLIDSNSLDLVFFDGDHTYHATMANFEMCLGKVHEGSVFVFDDIRWSNDMFKAWQQIVSNESVTISIDLFRMGIVFFRKGIIKQHFNIFY